MLKLEIEDLKQEEFDIGLIGFDGDLLQRLDFGAESFGSWEDQPEGGENGGEGEDFQEYGDDIKTEHKCPKCGYEW